MAHTPFSISNMLSSSCSTRKQSANAAVANGDAETIWSVAMLVMPQLPNVKGAFSIAEYDIMFRNERFDVCKIHGAANDAIRRAKAPGKQAFLAQENVFNFI